MATKSPKKNKPSSIVPGVYYRDDGAPRWEVKIRWTDASGQKRHLPTVRYPVDPKASPKTDHHVDQARKDAEAYASAQRADLHKKDTPHALTADAWTLRGLLERYVQEIEDGEVAYRAVRTDKSNCNTLLGRANQGPNKKAQFRVVDMKVSALTYGDFFSEKATALSKQYKGANGEAAGNSSVKRLLGTIRTVFNRAINHWEIELTNPLATLKGIEVDDARTRTLTGDEWDLIMSDMDNSRVEQGTKDAIAFTRHTAVRRGECVKLDWTDINFKDRTAHLRDTKSRKNTTKQRVIPLTPKAMEILERRKAERANMELKGPVFTADKGKRLRADTITQAWIRSRQRVAIEQDNPEILTARVHDLRHTRITELGRILSAAEAARVSGHSDLSSFFRYFNPDPVDIGRKIDELESNRRLPKDTKALMDQLVALDLNDLTAIFMAAMTRKLTAAGA